MLTFNDSEFDALVDKDATLRRLGTGFVFTEGPVWHPKEGRLIFSDIPGDKRLQWDGVECSVVSDPSNKGNGLTLDADGNLLVCEHATSSLVRLSGSRREVLATHFEGKELNSPNDVVVARDGSIWFTDPTYGRMPGFGVEREVVLGFQGVYKIPAGGGEPELVVDRQLYSQPNGLCFSPDETKLYVNDTDQGNIRVYDVVDGQLVNMRIFASGILDPDLPGAPDGMKVDLLGNVWCTAPGGLWIYAPDGRLIGKIAVPEFVGNFGWGGADWRTLFITASTSLYALDVKVGPHVESYMSGYVQAQEGQKDA
jgi:gluconolactonase